MVDDRHQRAVDAIVAELKKVATAQTKKTWLNHGAKEPCFGVKVEDIVSIDYKGGTFFRVEGDPAEVEGDEEEAA